jgi:hypothetical protein
MTCKCGSNRIAHIQGKSRDLNSIEIPHLDFEHDGYMMELGVGDGDYIEFSLCLDCGQVQNFEPITDETIKESEEWKMRHDADDDDDDADDSVTRARPNSRDKPTQFEKAITLKDMEKKRAITLMQDAFGPLWQKNKEAIDILKTTLGKPEAGAALREAIEELLNESSSGGNHKS